jgi:hypothetical protein
MRIRSLCVSVLGLTAIVSAFMRPLPVAVAATQGTRAIAALSAKERLHLPGSTRVTVDSGKVTTLGAMRAAHARRVDAFAQAASLGESIAARIRGQRFRPARNGSSVSDASGKVYALHAVATKSGGIRVETAGTDSPDIIFGLTSLQLAGSLSHIVLPKTKPPSGKIIPLPKSTLTKFSKDYQDFCKAANATACIYLPVVEAWEVVQIGNTNTLTYVDWMITDSKQCKSEGGTMGKSGCEYKYPWLQTTDYTPAASNPYVLNCPGTTEVNLNNGVGSFNILIDPRGAVTINPNGSTWKNWEGNLPVTETCVAQIYT